MKYQELRDAAALPEGIDLVYAIQDAATPETVRALLADADRADAQQETTVALCDAVDVMLKWLVKNVHRWNFSEYDYLHSANEKARAALSQGEQT